MSNKAKVSKRKKTLVTRLKSEIGKNMSYLTKICKRKWHCRPGTDRDFLLVSNFSFQVFYLVTNVFLLLIHRLLCQIYQPYYKTQFRLIFWMFTSENQTKCLQKCKQWLKNSITIVLKESFWAIEESEICWNSFSDWRKLVGTRNLVA